MALAGMMSAVAVVVMSLGSLIPVNTYVCPVLCLLLHRTVISRCGRRLGWCYYLAVALLSLMLAPDREAALVYGCIGWYPMVRPCFERLPDGLVRWTAKLLCFTGAGGLSFGLTMMVLGAEAVLAEFRESGLWLGAVTIVLWDFLMVMVDRLLGLAPGKRK
jgi:hypothetical protein